MIEALSYLLSSNGSHVCGFAKESLLPAAALVDHQQGNSQCRQHLVGLTHVVTDEVGGLGVLDTNSPFEVTVVTFPHSWTFHMWRQCP